MQNRSKFGWNPKVGDRVEGVGRNGGTGRFGTVVGQVRGSFVVEWDKVERTDGIVFKGGNRSKVQSYGIRKVEVR